MLAKLVARRLLIGGAIVICLPLLAVAKGDLTGHIEAFRVVLTEEGEEEFVPADEANPNDVIEYRLIYKNTSEEPVKSILITDPVPAGTQYIVASATDPDGGRVEFSIDKGRSYHAWPIKIRTTTSNGAEKVTEATPDMVTHIRWVIAEPLETDRVITVSYRTKVR